MKNLVRKAMSNSYVWGFWTLVKAVAGYMAWNQAFSLISAASSVANFVGFGLLVAVVLLGIHLAKSISKKFGEL